MDDVPSRNIASVTQDRAQRRIVPGPKSKAIFDREAEAMAPGLQSIALYSQIVVDHARGCTIIDVDGNEYLDFIAGVAIGSLGHCHPHYIKRLNEQLERCHLRQFHDRNSCPFSQFGQRVVARRHHPHPTVLGRRRGCGGRLPSR